ncbi:MAG: hypothetical protein HZA46_08840, partial [Planctomycetales bacterium]|nr:hypothetical protein [Planctomycetales bacterium]
MLFTSWMLSLRSWSRTQSRRTAASRRAATRRERLALQIAAVVERLENRLLLSSVTWDGGGNGTNWSDPLNWDGNVLPTSADDVTINFGSATVQHNTGTDTVNSLTTTNPFTLTGGTLSIVTTVQVNNTFTLNGGTLSGGTVNFADDRTLEFTNNLDNRLSGVTVNGDLTLEAIFAKVRIEGGTTFANAHLSGYYSTLGFAPGQTVTGNILFEGSSSGSRIVQMNGTSGTLTIGPTGSIKTVAGFGGWNGGIYNDGTTFGNGEITLVNQGLISAEAGGALYVSPDGGLTNTGTLQARSGGTLFVQFLPGNANTVLLEDSGSALILSGTDYVLNSGLSVAAGQTATLNGTWSTTGALNVTGGTLNLGGDFTTAGLNLPSFSNTGGIVNITGGTLNNIGDVLTLNNSTGQWNLAGGRLFGGTLNFADGQTLGFAPNNGHLNFLLDVTVNGDLTLSADNAWLDIQRDTTFANVHLSGDGTAIFFDTNRLPGNILFEGAKSGSRYVDVTYDHTLTVGPTVSIKTIAGFGGTGRIGSGFFFGVNMTLVNQGLISSEASGATLSIQPTNGFTNTGTLQATGGGTLNVSEQVIVSGTTSLICPSNGTITVSGNLLGDTQVFQHFSPAGTIRLIGSGTAANPQLLEVMSRDLGNVADGFRNNFNYGTLALANNTYVRLVDDSNNAAGAEGEALYVNSLVVPSGATLNLNGFNVYARTSQIDGTLIGGSVSQLPDSGALSFATPTSGTISVAGELDEWTFFGRTGRNVGILVNPGTSSPPAPVAPQLGFVEVTLVDAANNVVAQSSSPSDGALATLTDVTLPSDGTYRIQIRAASGHRENTGNYLIAAYDVAVDVTALSLNRTVVGNIENPFSVDRWTFSAVAGPQFQFDLVNAASSGIAFDLKGPGGVVLFSRLTGDSDLKTIVTPGNYTLTVYSTGSNAGAYSFRLLETTQTDLTLGTVYHGSLSGSGQAQLFRVSVPATQVLTVQLDDSTAADHNELYAKFGSPPTRSDYDVRFSSSATADQKLLVPVATAGTWYVLLYGSLVPAPSTYNLTASAADVVIESVSPDGHAAGSAATLTLVGAGFDRNTVVSLVAADATVRPATTTDVDSRKQITATFDLMGVPTGVYAVRVTRPGGDSADLPGAFTVLEGPVPHLETRLILPSVLGRHQVATLYVEYANTGTLGMPAPLLMLQSSDADNSDLPFFTLDRSRIIENLWTSALPDGLSHSIQILASGNTPGVLQPGESFRVPVYYSGLQRHPELPNGWDFNDTAVEMELRIFDVTEPTAIDWASIEDSSRPPNVSDEAWEPIFANLQAHTGTTWGDYVRVLSDNAKYLGRLGQRVVDIGQLWSFEVLQAQGLSPLTQLASEVDAAVQAPGLLLSYGRSFGSSIASRYEMGPFGRGWTAPSQTTWQRDADGSVTIIGTSGLRRRFQPDSRYAGRYFGQAGDNGTLIGGTGGTFQLRESNGFVTGFRADSKQDYLQDRNGNRITSSYDASGRATSLTHSAGQSLTIAYNAAGRIVSITSSNGHQATYTYDAANQHLLAVTGYDGLTTRYTYNTTDGAARLHALTSIEFPNGTHRLFTYDAEGRLTGIARDGNAEQTSFSYDATGKVTATNASGATKFHFEQHGLVTKVEDPLGNATQSSFDNNFHVTRITDSTGATRKFYYDLRGILYQSTDTLGFSTGFYHNRAFNQLTALTNANFNFTQYAYDSHGNLVSTTYPDNTVELATYDAIGNAVSTTNRRGQTTTYAYDAAGRITHQSFADGSQADFEYDARGNLTSAIDVGGTTSFLYDAADRMTRVTYPNGRFLDYTYDTVGRRTSMTDQDGFATRYEYDGTGRLSRLADTGGTTLVTYTYDTVGWRLSRKDQGNGTYTTYEYDAASQLLHLINRAPDNAINSRFDYTYDSLGRRVSMGTVDGTWAYSYDATGQLTRAVFVSTNPAVPNQDLTYVYDALGNRIRTVENGVTTAYVANKLNQYTTVGTAVLGYDADGNLVSETGGSHNSTYTYDTQNRLVGVVTADGAWTYEYDVFGNRIASVQNGERTEYLLDPTGLVDVVGEYDGSGNVVAHYSHGFGLTNRFDSAGSSTFYDFDAIGSTAGVTNASGSYANRYRYLPFGENFASTETVANPFEFVGQLGVTNEDNGLDFMRARFYSTDLGRFNGIDPLGIRSGTVNLFSYVGNTPVSFVDPSGLEKFELPQLPPIPTYFPPRPDGPVVGPDTSGNRNDPNPERTQEIERAQDDVGDGLELLDTTLDTLYNPIPDQLNPTRLGPEPDPNPPNGPSLPPFKFPKAPPPPEPQCTSCNPATTPNESPNVPQAVDPNDKIGPAGFGTANFVAASSVFPYRIDFENDARATAPAQRVDVTDQLSPNFDWNTLELTEVGFGDVLLDVPAHSQHFEATVPMNFNNQDFEVWVTIDLNAQTGLLSAQFLSVDPTTFLPPDVLTGFLPPEDGTGRGQGHFSYTIRPKENLTSGTAIRNIAIIQFDGGETIATNQIDPHDPAQGTDPTKEALVTIDVGVPASSVAALPTTASSAAFTVSWSGSDDASGSGIATYDVYVSDNGAPFVPFVMQTTATSATFSGASSHTYAFYSVATDNVGHREAIPTNSDTSTTTPPNVAPTLDNSGTPYLIAPAGSRLATEMSNGTLISDLLARGAGGNPITDADSGAVEGIALTGINKIDGTFGTWEFTLVANPQALDWINVETAGTLSDSSALLLPADADARLRFVTTLMPRHNTTANDGSPRTPAQGFLPLETKLDTGLTFRAWDRTIGTAGGRADTSINGGSTAFSTVTESAGTYFETRLYRSFNVAAELNTYTLEQEFNALVNVFGYQDRSTADYSGFTILMSPIPGVATSA